MRRSPYINANTQRSFDRRARGSAYSRRLRARYGRYNGATYDTTAPGGLGYVYVTLEAGGYTASTIAFNQSGVSFSGGDALWLDVNERNQAIITGSRFE